MTKDIKVLDIADVQVGMFIASVDDDEWTYGQLVDRAAYDADEQDWNEVKAITGPVDLPTLTLAYYNGEQFTERWQASASVWVLVDAAGDPVVATEA